MDLDFIMKKKIKLVIMKAKNLIKENNLNSDLLLLQVSLFFWHKIHISLGYKISSRLLRLIC